MPTATIAPISVHAALTPSLFSHPNPPARSVSVPQSCTTRSVALPHRVQYRRDCQSAPPNESTSAPMIPPADTARARCAFPLFQCSNHAASAMNNVPATIAASPSVLTPPEVPVGTLFIALAAWLLHWNNG